MSSRRVSYDGDPARDDRTTKARIRDAAIECFANNGVSETTARKVAAGARVSPGLVMHHFGSMEGLRSACDEYVAATIGRYKRDAMSEGPGLDVLAALQRTNVVPLMGYLAAVLSEDSPAVVRLVDDLVEDAEDYLQRGVESGMVRASADPRGRAAVMLLWSLGALVLHRHVRRILGVDLTDPDIGADLAIAAYAGPAYEIMSDGFLTAEFGAQVKAAFSLHPATHEPGVGTEPMEATNETSETKSKEGR